MKKLTLAFLIIVSTVISTSLIVFADNKVKLNTANTIWVLIAGFLVFFMQAGFAMVEAGFTRAKNASNIIMKNMMDVAIGSIAFFAIGFGIMFGADKYGLFGTTYFFGNIGSMWGSIPSEVFMLFQTVFAATAATIVSGAMAERTKFISYILYSFFISLVIYPVVGHWIWGGGWLSKLGMIDFAGSTVVHSVGGWAALVGASVLGPRIGKYSKSGKTHAIPGHSITLGALGVFILWFGWFGFNPGSTLSVDNSLGRIAMTTNLAAASAGIAAMIITWLKYKKSDVSMTLNGFLGGLVAITAGCANVTIWGSIFIGVISGIMVIYGIEFIDKVVKVDDPVGAVSVHGFSGALGTLLVGLFDKNNGLFYGGGLSLLRIQFIGVFSVIIWVLVTAFILFKAIDKIIGLRVSRQEEERGLDLSEHGIEAYNDFLIKSNDVIF